MPILNVEPFGQSPTFNCDPAEENVTRFLSAVLLEKVTVDCRIEDMVQTYVPDESLKIFVFNEVWKPGVVF
jgi:hypothetical protein